MKLLISFILGMLSFSAFAQPSTDEICTQEGFTFKDKEIIFNSDKATHRVFLIQNTDTGNIVLNHTKADSGAGAGWTSKLNSYRWSALAMNQSNFTLSCEGFNPPFYKMADCQNVINICTYPAKKDIGSFWIAENSDLLSILKIMKQRNIID